MHTSKSAVKTLGMHLHTLDMGSLHLPHVLTNPGEEEEREEGKGQREEGRKGGREKGRKEGREEVREQRREEGEKGMEGK